MLQSDQPPESTYDDARLLVCVRFLASWLLGGTILSVQFGLWTGMSVGLIAIGYVKAVHWKLVLAALAPRSRRRLGRRDSSVPES